MTRQQVAVEYNKLEVIISGRFSTRGKNKGEDSKTTCLKNVRIHGTDVTFDHIWLKSELLNDIKLKTNQTVTLLVQVRQRKRPPTSLYADPEIDLSFKVLKEIK